MLAFAILFGVSLAINFVLLAALWLTQARAEELEGRVSDLADKYGQLWSASAETLAEARTEPARPTGGPEDWFGCDEQEGGD